MSGFSWRCGPLTGNCETADELLHRIFECARHHRFVARDKRGALVACIDFDGPRETQIEVPIVNQRSAA